MTKTIQNMTILRADRSECNESEAKEMVGCLADGDWVIAYFPTLSAMRQASIFAAAPDLLSALGRLLQISQNELDQSATHEGLLNCEALANARAAIAKAERGEA
jgi:hypothetical protein